MRAYCYPLVVARGPGGDCDKPLAGALQAALDATGAASPVTRLTSHDRVYDALNAGHCDRAVRDQTLPHALEWAWMGYHAPDEPEAAQARTSQ
jgi:hypothetical protein